MDSKITVNGLEYELVAVQSPVCIVILQRGWVMVGELKKAGSDCVLKKASVIRTWGTTRGLGEIAKDGPIKDKTVLDPCHGPVRFDSLTVVASIDCDASKWVEHLV